MPTNDDVRKTYDSVASAYQVLLPDMSIESPVDRALVAAFAEHVTTGSNTRMLDAGCGPGRAVETLTSLGLDVVGVDLSPTMIQLARVAHPQVRFEVADLIATPFADGEFGGVFAWYSLIHTPPERLNGVLAELTRVLVDGGFFLTGFQAGEGVREIRNAYGQGIDHTAYLHNTDFMGHALEKQGCTVVAMCTRLPATERHPQGFVLAQKTWSAEVR